jgi:hypothetical protein
MLANIVIKFGRFKCCTSFKKSASLVTPTNHQGVTLLRYWRLLLPRLRGFTLRVAKLAASSSHNLPVINLNERTCALVLLNKNAVNLTALSGCKSKLIFDSSACYSTERICF